MGLISYPKVKLIASPSQMCRKIWRNNISNTKAGLRLRYSFLSLMGLPGINYRHYPARFRKIESGLVSICVHSLGNFPRQIYPASLPGGSVTGIQHLLDSVSILNIWARGLQSCCCPDHPVLRIGVHAQEINHAAPSRDGVGRIMM